MLSSLSARIDAWRAPAPAADRVAWLKAQPYAHRGLHGHWAIENSLPAFELAIDQGHGIECDVQGANDGTAFVFHDETLERLTREIGTFSERTARQLDAIELIEDHGPIPRLRAMLESVAGRVPVLIEIKARGAQHVPLCLSVRRALEGYTGKAAIMSFNPLVVRWFARSAPHVLRGLVITEHGKQGLADRLTRHMDLWTAQPEFLAYDIRDIPSRFAAAQRARGFPVLTWTVRGAEDEARALQHADEVIYEMPVAAPSPR